MERKLRVLIVDDASIIRTLVREQLKALGHEVAEEASNGKDALGIFEQNRDGFDLVITGYRTFGLTGTMLGLGIRALRPRMPIIIMTGDDADTLKPRDHGFPVLEKPFSMVEFQEAIKKACGGE